MLAMLCYFDVVKLLCLDEFGVCFDVKSQEDLGLNSAGITIGSFHLVCIAG